MQPHLQQASVALRQHYGTEPLPGEPGTWETAVKLIIGRGLGPDRVEKCWTELAETSLVSAAETYAASVAEIQEFLECAPNATCEATVLHSIADWWVRHADNEGSNLPQFIGQSASQLEGLRNELRQIPGLGLEQTDRILLFVANLPAYPLDRSSMRIACRHGWLDPEADYEETQSFFVRACEGDPRDLQQFSLWSAKTGKDFCGPQPKCERCPLRHLLPEGGPYHNDDA